MVVVNRWRRERDSNPRGGISAYTISNRAPSAARTSLRTSAPGSPAAEPLPRPTAAGKPSGRRVLDAARASMSAPGEVRNGPSPSHGRATGGRQGRPRPRSASWASGAARRRARAGPRGRRTAAERRHKAGGEGGIRTHGTLAGTTVFETVLFNRSSTSPGPILHELRAFAQVLGPGWLRSWLRSATPTRSRSPGPPRSGERAETWCQSPCPRWIGRRVDADTRRGPTVTAGPRSRPSSAATSATSCAAPLPS